MAQRHLDIVRDELASHVYRSPDDYFTCSITTETATVMDQVIEGLLRTYGPRMFTREDDNPTTITFLIAPYGWSFESVKHVSV